MFGHAHTMKPRPAPWKPSHSFQNPEPTPPVHLGLINPSEVITLRGQSGTLGHWWL